MGDLCILIPTFEKYRVVAEFTRAKLDQHWLGEKRFLCGSEMTLADYFGAPIVA